MEFQCAAEVIVWKRKATWFFALLPEETSQVIREVGQGLRGGFGSIRVQATIGATTWGTSIFPDPDSDSYLLPLKAAVRAAEDIAAGDTVTVTVALVV